MSATEVRRLEEIDDSKIAATFEYQVRGEITQIVLANYSHFDSLPDKRELRAGVQALIVGKVDRDMDRDTRARFLAEWLFNTLDEQILSKNCFGLEAIDDGITEDGLCSFETKLEKNKEVGMYTYLEWRAKTVTYALQMGQGQPSPRPAMVANMIHNAMIPCLKKTSTQEDKDKLLKRWIKVCEDTFQLSLTLRRAKALYKCEYPYALRYDQDTMEKWGKIPLSRGKQKDYLAFVLMPSLVKLEFSPESPEPQKKTLVKAQVFLYGEE